MNFLFRRKPLAQLICFASVLVSGTALQAQTQSTSSWRVDPVLLASPPIRSENVPAPAEALTASDTAPVSTIQGTPVTVTPVHSTSSPTSPIDAALPSLMREKYPAAKPVRMGLVPLVKKPAKSWYERLWAPVAEAYDKGSLEFFLPLETYHFRSKYTAEKIAIYQERPKGFGVGRGHYDAKGNWEGVYALAFQDSHYMPMYFAGYGWKALWRPAEDVRLGLGYNAGLMSRTDILGYVPFPIAMRTFVQLVDRFHTCAARF